MPETIRRSRQSGIPFVDLLARLRDRLMGQMEITDMPFARSIQKIDDIGKMTPGWNGFKAAVADENARRAAKSFLQQVPRRFPMDVQEPTIIAPTSDGGVSIAWRLADAPRSFELVFMPDGAHEWALREKERTIQYLEGASEQQLLDLMKQHIVGRATVTLH